MLYASDLYTVTYTAVYFIEFGIYNVILNLDWHTTVTAKVTLKYLYIRCRTHCTITKHIQDRVGVYVQKINK